MHEQDVAGHQRRRRVGVAASRASSRGEPLSDSATLLLLQQTAGNHAVSRALTAQRCGDHPCEGGCDGADDSRLQSVARLIAPRSA